MIAANVSTTNASNFTNFSNTTTADFGPMAIIFTVFSVTALFFNGLVLIVFLTDFTLWTPFNLYIINLLIANILVSGVQNPFEIIIATYDKWWLGEAGCTAYLYVSNVFQAGVSGAHILIAVNRTWAIIHPLSYRSFHSRPVALGLCLGMHLYNHIFLLSGIIPDALFYRNSLPEGKCYMNVQAQLGWSITSEVIIYNSPQLVMVVSMVIIVVLKKRRKRWKTRLIGPTKVEPSSASGTSERRPSKALLTSQVNEDRDTKKRESSAYKILVFLTVSSVICWTPLDVYYTVTIFHEFGESLFYPVASVLHMFQVVIDPVLFTISSPNLRKSLRAFLTCRQ